MNLKKLLLIVIYSFLISINGFSQSALTIQNPRCEYRINPINIDVAKPVFSWTMKSSLRNGAQTAYEIIVESMGKTGKSGKVFWNSGLIKSDNSSAIQYEGKKLRSGDRYYWKIRVYDQNGKASRWSDGAWFETGFLNSSDWHAHWIGDDRHQFEKDEDFYQDDPMPLFKKSFPIRKKIKLARLYISGLGYYECAINGKPVTNNKLDPGFTSYKNRVLYNTYDISKILKKNVNLINVALGNGWWNPLPLRLFHTYNLRNVQETGRPCLKASVYVRYDDGTDQWINTDQTWKTTTGTVIRNSVYLGEYDDGRRAKSNLYTNNYKGWQSAVLVKGPSGNLRAQAQPPIRVTRVIHPISIKQLAKDTFIVDFGQNFAGVARIKVHGRAGDEIRLRYGEALFPDGRLNYLTTVAGHIKEIWHLSGGPGAPKTAWQEDRYALKGGATEVWSPQFTFHSFRYVEITGWPGKPELADIEGLRMNADLEQNGEFSCSNELFNQLHKVIQWTFLSNVFSVQSDCPGREKMGYGGDMVATSDAYIFNYNMDQFYRKSINDFANEQQPDGALTEIAPYTGIADHGYGGESGPLGWELAFSYLQKQLYDFYGDSSIIRQYYPVFKKQMDFLETKAKNYLFDRDISDHEAIDPKPEGLTAAAFYYHHAILASEFAGILKIHEDSVKYARLASNIKTAILQKYEQLPSGQFDKGTESAQSFALWYNLPTDYQASLNRLTDAITAKENHIATGIFGTKMLFDVLRINDLNNKAFEIVNQKTFPGWGFMLSKGATTLWESWTYPDNATSQNHPMFGSVDEWFYRSILGVNPLAPGFKVFQIKPQPAGDLTWAKGSYNSIQGKIECSWVKAPEHFELKVSIPANTTAQIYIPSGEGLNITESSRNIRGNPDFKNVRYEKGYCVFDVGSGNYSFEAKN